MKKYIEIIADTNDGDYVSERNEINDETLEIIKPVIEAIKNFKPYTVKNVGYDKKSDWTHHYNFPTNDIVREDLGELDAHDYYLSKGITEEQFETFSMLVPYGEYGIHTVVSIKILEIVNETNLL